ncbi:hypothetical protein [Micromonospora sp. NPDC005203]|uniref:hypothetical protein n=1 Tax=Micromonospora sp. NPDC005203 TaxID=3364226 RepID=UPI00368EF5EF
MLRTLRWVVPGEEPLLAIADVNLDRRDKRGPVLDIITTDENIRLTFDDWAGKRQGLDDSRRLANLLAAAMDLPEAERRTDPLLSGGSSTDRAITR